MFSSVEVIAHFLCSFIAYQWHAMRAAAKGQLGLTDINKSQNSFYSPLMNGYQSPSQKTAVRLEEEKEEKKKENSGCYVDVFG